MYNHYECIKTLLKYGATHEMNIEKKSPLYYAIVYFDGKNENLLVKYGALQNGYNSGFNNKIITKYTCEIYPENINKNDWQCETIYYILNEKINFNLTCEILKLLYNKGLQIN